MKIILASKSPRRIELLKLLKIDFEVISSNIDENISEKDPKLLAEKLSYLKAMSIKKDGVVLAADTVVTLDKEIFGKPRDYKDAFRMLKSLSGKWHTVITGVTIKFKDEVITFSEKTNVKFKNLSKELIEFYINTAKPFDKAGGYGIQELGSVLVEKIEGDYFNVVGLPISKVWDILWDRGMIDASKGEINK
ncbi:Maf-like protein [Thermosipho africanus H17ap60334]|jgi:septum formation protein|uniref:Maf family protein n=1 Tax=Thermosipho TaxID=2420 RepID=UPI00028CC93F|nr:MULTISPECIES: Maf family protein [Thermosipho]HCF37611.1 septum formation protein Maf [Thermosipho africanus]EKF48673.1 Maf-like protein [Thermosipho africanus H17ap60334]MBZ4650229.1 maf septum formation protein Maf [Thermosipho sp. (in: thermotogales)]MDK2838951.1 nucleoside triphosphate pyrophosphatase [Thermosipho sp. (in: thermotogales)]MDK2899889.1 nucleoside triphosphate pyrophosphatase [Thermosipho sp. (in: thermotogales)]